MLGIANDAFDVYLDSPMFCFRCFFQADSRTVLRCAMASARLSGGYAAAAASDPRQFTAYPPSISMKRQHAEIASSEMSIVAPTVGAELPTVGELPCDVSAANVLHAPTNNATVELQCEGDCICLGCRGEREARACSAMLLRWLCVPCKPACLH